MIVWRINGFSMVVHGVISSKATAYAIAEDQDGAIDVFRHAMFDVKEICFDECDLSVSPCSAVDLLRIPEGVEFFYNSGNQADKAIAAIEYLRELEREMEEWLL